MIYLIDPNDINMGKPCKTFCDMVCSVLCVSKNCQVKPLYGIDI